jgi:PTH1 family peptidyl-tRNA hydrolase
MAAGETTDFEADDKVRLRALLILLKGGKRVDSNLDQTSTENKDTRRKMIVGLGNPGRQYRETRHNIGFMLVDDIATVQRIKVGKLKNQAIIGEGSIGRVPVVLAKPQTSMNLSGSSVGPLARFFKIEPENILVVYDELDLPFGTLRLRGKGGAGGHNGMKSIIQHIGNEFPRMRLGIGRPPGRMPPAAYVLQKFSKGEEAIRDEMLDAAVSAVETWLVEGIEQAMSRHNGIVVDVEDE